MAVADKVCLLGDTVARTLFPDQDPVGQILRIKNLPFRVLGVLAPKGQTSWGDDQDDFVLAPYTTVQKKLQGIQHHHNGSDSAVGLTLLRLVEENQRQECSARRTLEQELLPLRRVEPDELVRNGPRRRREIRSGTIADDPECKRTSCQNGHQITAR